MIVGTRSSEKRISLLLSTRCGRAMAVAPISIEDALKLGSTDLRFTLNRNDVSNDVQAAFFTNKVTTVQKFSSFFRSETDLVEVLRDSFGVNATAGLEQRAQVASVMCAWKEAQTKMKRQAEVEAEMDTREWTKPIPTGDYISLRNAFMEIHGRLEDKVTPSKEFLEKKLQELENGEFRAETLAEVVSKDEVDPDVLVPVFDSKGSLTVKKGATTVALPSGPEQLRRRLSVMQNALIMLALKHTNREEIQDISKELFDRYKDYILGDFVYGLSATDLNGQQIQTPPWSLVLSYEQAIRKKAYQLMLTDKLKLGAAMEQAWKCPVTKERFFITPLALYSKRSYPQQEWSPKGKGKTKGKEGKGKGKSSTKGAAVAPDGQKICFRFNAGKCTHKGCKFAHLCNKCFKKGHNAMNCKDAKAPDTTGH